MNFEVGSIVEGKVTGIKPFGAFVALNDNVQGLVHISEVSHGFVKDINDALSVGDVVSVKVLSVDEDSKKISLSIRQTQEAPAPAPKKERRPGGFNNNNKKSNTNNQDANKGFNTLEAKLKDWLKESTDRQAQLNKRLKK
ncbi:MAG: S1 domain-containing post-transcriptional regulator GSP13 [Bacillota bacterium]|jgi:general stress protein 13|uniref:RNA-binding protein S1 n=3 Tax=Fictibacillus TaxID=1329200 RepID=A0A160IR06_9BACL|nr:MULTISPECIES: S1 domain-containing post-transcriptional regulator GSP13 [Bacillaceae]ANC78292.1 RNA-binding protein S1 [Fictibacillus phosphorivorans]MBD7962796.1 general stress protein 13 [Fictibacillus norfolkensis]MBH0157984.1 general stress protein 13 [Fictibacillus sp. 5RED26]MBH0159613.1 general stress protein 13 [Fictibacillus sp. 26RED30]MBH0163587.1 general stress protein 13 [Fictibacillus sp. 7GRE50]